MHLSELLEEFFCYIGETAKNRPLLRGRPQYEIIAIDSNWIKRQVLLRTALAPPISEFANLVISEPYGLRSSKRARSQPFDLGHHHCKPGFVLKFRS